MSETIEQVKKDLEFFESKGYYPKRLASSLTSTLYSLITTIESQNTKIESLLKMLEGNSETMQLQISEIEQKDALIESQQKKLDYKDSINRMSVVLIEDREKEIESLKAITELAVKGLKEIKAYEVKLLNHYPDVAMKKISKDTLSEIERIQNAQT